MVNDCFAQQKTAPGGAVFVAYFAAILLIIYINSSYHDDRESGNITGDNKMELIQKEYRSHPYSFRCNDWYRRFIMGHGDRILDYLYRKCISSR